MNEPLTCKTSVPPTNSAPARAIDKQLISDAFSSSAASYDSGASLQRKVGNLLLEKLSHAPMILDLGTGPGYFTSALVDKCEQLTGIDIAPDMIEFAKARNHQLSVNWMVGDAEILPIDHQQMDAIFSSLMLQWVHQLPVAIAEAYRVLKPGGQFVFSTLLDGTLFELAQAWTHVDDKQHVNTFVSKAMLSDVLAQSAFVEVEIDVLPQVIYYDSVIALMKDLKAIGANKTAQKGVGLMGRGALKKLANGYEAYRTSQGLSATYQVAYCSLRKPL